MKESSLIVKDDLHRNNLVVLDAPLAVIIGAGRTGRGFIGRLLSDTDYRIVFIEKTEDLAARINETGCYSVYFFGDKRTPVRVTGVSAISFGSEAADDVIARASIVFTAVGEQNLPSLANLITQAGAKRQLADSTFRDQPLFIITCENGTEPAVILRDSILKLEHEGDQKERGIFHISEAAIFCTTIEKEGTQLDICSESYDDLPFDAERVPGFTPIAAMKAEPDFPKLLQRKIYTYNCISACIAYIGALKGYEIYAEAANDPDIGIILSQLIDPLDHAISVHLKVDVNEQKQLSARALLKFSDRHIRDDIARNARGVSRKLGPNERLIAPALMVFQTRGNLNALALTIAAAMNYKSPDEPYFQQKLTHESPEQALSDCSGLALNHPIIQHAATYYYILQTMGNKDNLSAVIVN